jgi:RNA polymerase sigma-70 factor (ECF subfamily)
MALRGIESDFAQTDSKADWIKFAGRLAKPMLFGRQDSKRVKFEHYAEQCFASLFAAAYRMTHSKEEAEDLVQEAMVRAFEAFDRFDGGNFRAWALRILTNLYINKYRSKRRGPVLLSTDEETVAEPMSGPETAPDHVLFQSSLGAEVMTALQLVPTEFRTAVLLSDVEGLSYQDIADNLDIPIGTVRSRIARGRSLLRKQLENYAKEEGYLKDSPEPVFTELD